MTLARRMLRSASSVFICDSASKKTAPVRPWWWAERPAKAPQSGSCLVGTDRHHGFALPRQADVDNLAGMIAQNCLQFGACRIGQAADIAVECRKTRRLAGEFIAAGGVAVLGGSDDQTRQQAHKAGQSSTSQSRRLRSSARCSASSRALFGGAASAGRRSRTQHRPRCTAGLFPKRADHRPRRTPICRQQKARRVAPPGRQRLTLQESRLMQRRAA
jgi:hypothetical protein